jgi:hypothetical protein
MTCYIAYETNTKGKVRLNRDILSSDNYLLIKKLPPSTYFRRKFFKAKTILNWLNYPSSPEKVAEIIDESFNKYYSMIEPDYDWAKEPQQWDPYFIHNYISRTHCNFKSFIQSSINMSEGVYYKHHGWYLRNLALRRGSRLLVAIKKYHNQHGTWPETLDAIKSDVQAEALIDPVASNKFKYENHGERFSLFGESVNIWPK